MARAGPRVPLVWLLQWLLVFLISVALMSHINFWQSSSSVDDESSGGPLHRRLLPLGGRAPPPPPARQCPITEGNIVPWGTLPRDPAKNRAAVFTPYNIVFGGGERYLLSVVAVMQDMGYTVDVLVTAANACKTKAQLMRVASGLRVALKPELLNFHTVAVSGITIKAPAEGYSLFMLLGNEKLPVFSGLGHVNMYMCQFPFDLDRPAQPQHIKSLATYDYVLLNSEFTDRWYNNYASPAMESAMRLYSAAPSIVVLHPPVEPFPAKSQLQSGSEEGGGDVPAVPQRTNIMLLGRFFRGRQSKGHFAAIDIFESILPNLPPNTHLHLIGNLMPGHKEYLNKLRKRAAQLPVHFHVGVTPQKIEEIMHSSLVQWHLTGVELESSADPASEEHFGISVAEGMSAGVIPVVLHRGGVTDIVKHGVNGYLGQDAAAVAEFTRHVFGLDASSLEQLRHNAISYVERFSPRAFAKNFRVLAQRGVLTKPFRFLIHHTSDVVNSRQFTLPTTSSKAAVIIEPRQHYAFEYAVKNVMYHLGKDWTLYVYHGLSNEAFVHHALESVANVKFRRLEAVQISIPALNRLLKSPEFWGELEAEHVLFFQTDSILIHGNIAPFLQYDYVGAPWHRKNERWGPRQQQMPHGVGNGGLSLRSVPAMLALSQRFGVNSTDGQQEDFMYSGLMEQLPEYQLAPRKLAYQFCVEVPCDDLEMGLVTAPGALPATLPATPLALHAAWYYFWGNPRRFADLLYLLEQSVCGAAPPEGVSVA